MFRINVLSHIDETIFKDLFSDKMGAPNASIQVFIGMMALKEAFGWSDSQLFENFKFNLLVRRIYGKISSSKVFFMLFPSQFQI